MSWYQCSSCAKHVWCPARLNEKIMKEIKAKGDCLDYDYKPRTHLRSTYK